MTDLASLINEKEQRAFLIRDEVQTGLMWTFYQGRRFFEAFRVATRPADLAKLQNQKAARLRSRLEEAEFVMVAYRPVRWLRLAVDDGLTNPEAADIYLRHAEGLGTVRHKREHFDDYIPLGKHAGKLKMVEAEGSIGDPTGTVGTGEKVLLGNLVDVAEIMSAARDTHAALAGSKFWPDWQVLPFEFMDL